MSLNAPQRVAVGGIICFICFMCWMLSSIVLDETCRVEDGLALTALIDLRAENSHSQKQLLEHLDLLKQLRTWAEGHEDFCVRRGYLHWISYFENDNQEQLGRNYRAATFPGLPKEIVK